MEDIKSKTLSATYAKNALGSTVFCNLIFDDNSLIVATTAGNVFLSYMFTIGAIYHKICMNKHKQVSNELTKLNTSEILKYSKLNFQIDYADITKIEELNRLAWIEEIFFPKHVRAEDYNPYRYVFWWTCRNYENSRFVGLKLALNTEKLIFKKGTPLEDVLKVRVKGSSEELWYKVSFDGDLYSDSDMTFLDDFKTSIMYIVIVTKKNNKFFTFNIKDKESIPFNIKNN